MNIQKIQTKIFEVRGQKVMLDFDLAKLYEVETRSLKQAVKRNRKRFPHDFMFQLTKREWKELITICDNLPEGVKFSPATPFAFTEQGVSMLSSVLRSKKAIQVNVAIMRARFNRQFKDIYDAINYLLQKDKQQTDQKQRKRIGFRTG